jgi:hypothetical protein
MVAAARSRPGWLRPAPAWAPRSTTPPSLRHGQLNQNLADIAGLPIAAHLGRTPDDSDPQLWPTLAPLYRRAPESRVPVVNAVVSGATRAAPGPRQPWPVGSCPVRAATGSPLGLGSVVSEITECKRPGEALQQARDELERRGHEHTADLVATNARLRQVSLPQRLTRTARVDRERGRLSVAVGDAGPGIGLGPPLCRGIIEAYGGRLSVHS